MSVLENQKVGASSETPIALNGGNLAAQDAAVREAQEAAEFLMDGLSTLNGCLRPRTGRNDWLRDFSAALTGSLSPMNPSAATLSVFCLCARARVQKAAMRVGTPDG